MHFLPAGQDLSGPQGITHDEFEEFGVIPLYVSHFAGGVQVPPHLSVAPGLASARDAAVSAGLGVASTRCGGGVWVADGEHAPVAARSSRSRVCMRAWYGGLQDEG